MYNEFDGQIYKELIQYGLNNLVSHCDIVNKLNVFPVPDGDTGTNMVLTLKNGFNLVEKLYDNDLASVSKKFADGVLFGARGNSGVIISQFFYGLSELFFDQKNADCKILIAALENGVKRAYCAVANPVEGTMLTVLRESTEFVKEIYLQGELGDIHAVISCFLSKARESLANTPNLLEVLRSAGVVDSGGAGIVYIFEGMEKFFSGDTVTVELVEKNTSAVDFSIYDRKSKFDLGYCTELLIQLTESGEHFDKKAYHKALESLGESVVLWEEDSKVKVHIHTKEPEKILLLSHKYGEFLEIKIENMTVQNDSVNRKQKAEDNKADILKEDVSIRSEIALVAVSHDSAVTQMFKGMGVEVVLEHINGDTSTNDFISAFEAANAENIIVFPNDKNALLAVEQAKNLYDGSAVYIVRSKSISECYAALSMVEMETDNVASMVFELNDIVDNIYTVFVTQIQKNTVYNDVQIQAGDYVSFLEKKIMLAAENSAFNAAISAIKHVMETEDREIITIFTGKNVASKDVVKLQEVLIEEYPAVEIGLIETEMEAMSMIISLE